MPDRPVDNVIVDRDGHGRIQVYYAVGDVIVGPLESVVDTGASQSAVGSDQLALIYLASGGQLGFSTKNKVRTFDEPEASLPSTPGVDMIFPLFPANGDEMQNVRCSMEVTIIPGPVGALGIDQLSEFVCSPGDWFPGAENEGTTGKIRGYRLPAGGGVGLPPPLRSAGYPRRPGPAGGVTPVQPR